MKIHETILLQSSSFCNLFINWHFIEKPAVFHRQVLALNFTRLCKQTYENKLTTTDLRKQTYGSELMEIALRQLHYDNRFMTTTLRQRNYEN